MDGWEFRAAQKSDPKLARIPVLAVSADGSAKAAAIDAEAYLRKPLSTDALLDTISRILGEAERRRLLGRLEEAERFAALGRLAASVGHEINNPLAYVAMNVEQAMSEVARLLAQDAPGPGAGASLPTLLRECRVGLDRIRDVVQGSAAALATRRGPPRDILARRSAGRVAGDGAQPGRAPRPRAKAVRRGAPGPRRSVGPRAGVAQPDPQRGAGAPRGARRGERGDAHDVRARGPRHRGDRRHRRRHPAPGPAAHLRPVLHDQADRRRDGARAGRLLPHRRRPRRADRRRERGRPGLGVPGGPPCADAGGRRAAAGGEQRSRPHARPRARILVIDDLARLRPHDRARRSSSTR